jgi:hypothetical protein
VRWPNQSWSGLIGATWMGRWFIALDMVMAVRHSEGEVARVAKGDIGMAAVEVDDRFDDVRGFVAVELDDEFAEVGLKALDAVFYQERIEVDFLSRHRLGLGELGDFVRGGSRGLDVLSGILDGGSWMRGGSGDYSQRFTTSPAIMESSSSSLGVNLSLLAISHFLTAASYVSNSLVSFE